MSDDPDIDIAYPYKMGRMAAGYGNWGRGFVPDPLPNCLLDLRWSTHTIEMCLGLDIWEISYQTQRTMTSEFWFRQGYNSRRNELLEAANGQPR